MDAAAAGSAGGANARPSGRMAKALWRQHRRCACSRRSEEAVTAGQGLLLTMGCEPSADEAVKRRDAEIRDVLERREHHQPADKAEPELGRKGLCLRGNRAAAEGLGEIKQEMPAIEARDRQQVHHRE